ncbi:hypothetical protein AW736_02440 [Termitidicoccus mucosus]|uniref:Uncharacterized protein n=1 Tax=Termitidicoccus mucosus TaxID=1184151 RepID=A0A178IQG6_9BACT|nr:hypothetical protein AW736_02460 [Opitutaceae bacterium TSB47]OAM91589.1 hypothetical protein AW736_02440 [Opitutaceae bacterium TSB47]
MQHAWPPYAPQGKKQKHPEYQGSPSLYLFSENHFDFFQKHHMRGPQYPGCNLHESRQFSSLLRRSVGHGFPRRELARQFAPQRVGAHDEIARKIMAPA